MAGSFTNRQEQALAGYCRGDYRLINAGLRGDEPLTAAIRARIATIDAAFMVAPFLAPATLYRGLNADAVAAIGEARLQPRQVYADAGYASTSRLHSRALHFAAWPAGGGLIMVINCPRPFLAIEMHRLSPYPDEQEVLLQRETQLLITGVDYATRTLNAEVRYVE